MKDTPLVLPRNPEWTALHGAIQDWILHQPNPGLYGHAWTMLRHEVLCRCEHVDLPSLLLDIERTVLRDALEQHPDDLAAAARSIGYKRTTFHYRLHKTGIRPYQNPATQSKAQWQLTDS